MNLEGLKQFIPNYKWRVQSFSKNYPAATCVAYVDARDVMELLDEIVGPENWQSDYKELKGNLYAGVGIKVEGEWVWKWDCGTESTTEKEKGEASDAFKRAAVKWGVGRFLYDLPIQYVKANDKKTGDNWPYVIDDQGLKVKDLTTYINGKIGNIPVTKSAGKKTKKSDAGSVAGDGTTSKSKSKDKSAIEELREEAVSATKIAETATAESTQATETITPKLPDQATCEKFFRSRKTFDGVQKAYDSYIEKCPDIYNVLWFRFVYVEMLMKLNPEKAKAVSKEFGFDQEQEKSVLVTALADVIQP